MSRNKSGFADLKRLRASAQADQESARAKAAAQAKLNRPQRAKPLSEDEVKLFARATQLVQPLKSYRTRVMHAPASQQIDAGQLEQKRNRATGVGSAGQINSNSKPFASGLTTQISDGYTPIEDTTEDIAWHAPGIGPDTLRKLRQAWWPVGSQIDLHGLTIDQARQAVIDFIDISRQHGTRCVRIIHGQGYGSPTGEGVLRSQVAQWLTQLHVIAAFATAPKAHGGRGALLALVRLS